MLSSAIHNKELLLYEQADIEHALEALRLSHGVLSIGGCSAHGSVGC